MPRSPHLLSSLLLAACTGAVSPPIDADSSQDSPGADSPEGADTAPRSDTETPGQDTSPPADTGDADPNRWRSVLYPADWMPGFTVDDRFLHDFSYAGYHNGEAPLPTLLPGASYDVTDYGADPSATADSTTAIQAAIDAAEAAGGGTVWLPAGAYRLEGLLTITVSGVVLAGAGPDKTRLHFTRGTSMTDTHHITVRGTVQQGSDRWLLVDGEPLSRTVQVSDVSGLAVGDDVYLGWTITEDFVSDHGMTGTWYSFNGQWKPFFRLTITAIRAETGEVEVDVPLRYPAQVRDGASLRRVEGYLSECGVQGFSISTAVDWSDAWSNDRSRAIGMIQVKDCWVQDIASIPSPFIHDGRGDHLQNGGIIIQESKRVTVADTTMEEAQNRGDGGDGYLFEITRSNEVLIRDAQARAGRHNFIQNWDFGTSGCVFLRTLSEDGAAVYSEDFEWFTWTGYSEFHHSLAMANLIDASTATDGWQALNRQDYSSGAGHTATQNVFWNLTGGALTSTQFGTGYVIGTTDVTLDVTVWDILGSEGTAPEDYVERQEDGASLQPVSLYEDQLVRRLARGDTRWSR